MNHESFPRVGFAANLDGTDERLRLYVSTAGSSVANDILYLDNMERGPLKQTLAN